MGFEGLSSRDGAENLRKLDVSEPFDGRKNRNEFGAGLSEGILLAHAGIETVEKPTFEDYEKALKHENEARKIIADYLKKEKKLTARQRKILEAAKDFDHEQFLAIVIKESYLQSDIPDGYAQITIPVISELNMMLPFLKATGEKSQRNPSLNMAYGLIYLAILRVQYIEKANEFKKLSSMEKADLIGIMHNLGPTAVRQIWRELAPNSVEDFVNKMEDYVAKKLGKDVSYKVVTDETYEVAYKETAVSAYRLETETHPVHENPVFDQQAFGLSYPNLRKLLITARYYRITKGITEALKKDEKAYIGKLAMEGERNEVAKIDSGQFEDYVVKPKENLWRIGFERGVSVGFLKKIYSAANPGRVLRAETLEPRQIIKVPKSDIYRAAAPYFYEKFKWTNVSEKGFWASLVANVDYNEYLKSRINIDREDVVEVIVNFNQRFNPELKNLRDDATNLPQEAFVWVPNARYFSKYFANVLPALPVAPSPAAPAAPRPEPEPAPTPPVTPPEVIEGAEKPDKKSAGQYVTEKNGAWVLDKKSVKKGAEKFKAKEWKDHPKWTVVTDLKGRLFDDNVRLEDVRFIILHSTISTTSASTIEKKKAHFVVERDGTIKYVVSVEKNGNKSHQATPHAGISRWNGVEDLNRHSIGIEVVAKNEQEWSRDQIKAVKKLVEFLGGYHGLKKMDVLTHYQIAYSRKYGRGRKSDPYSRNRDLFGKLDLPDNLKLLDLSAAQGHVRPNIGWIKASSDHDKKVWPGLKAVDGI